MDYRHNIETKVLRCSEEQYKRQDCHTWLLTNTTTQNFIATIYSHQKCFINIKELFNSVQKTSSHFTGEWMISRHIIFYACCYVQENHYFFLLRRIREMILKISP